jgi:hypothetical protein
MLRSGGELQVSTMHKAVIGGIVLVVLSGGVAWAAIEASSSQRSYPSGPSIGGRRLPLAPAARPGVGGPGAPGGLRGPKAFLRPQGIRGFGGSRLLCGIAHAEAVLVGPDGTHDVRLDHGTVASVASHALTIKEADGSTITVAVDGTTIVRRDGRQASLSDLRSGDSVFAVREGSAGAKFVRAFDSATDRCAQGALGVPEPSPFSP